MRQCMFSMGNGIYLRTVGVGAGGGGRVGAGVRYKQESYRSCCLTEHLDIF